jgi:hypothetical protein
MPSRPVVDDPFVRSIELVLAVARRGRFRVALIGGFALPFHGVQRATGDVNFLVDARGADRLHAALLEAGARGLHRSADAASYGAVAGRLSPLDFIYAHRARAQRMLARAKRRLLRGARLRVPVVGVEALVGLKLQAMANEPGPVQHEADIRALLAASRESLDTRLLRDNCRLFDRERDLDRLLARARKGSPPSVVKRSVQLLVGPAVRSQAELRPVRPVRDLDEFIRFLRRLETVFGPVQRPRQSTHGDRFRL